VRPPQDTPVEDAEPSVAGDEVDKPAVQAAAAAPLTLTRGLWTLAFWIALCELAWYLIDELNRLAR
jgi:hypothetical protein